MGKILAGQVNLGFIELRRELARCRKLQQTDNEGRETLRKGKLSAATAEQTSSQLIK